MDTPRAAAVTEPPAVSDSGPSISPWRRAIAVFTRPADAWAGLETRAQWWFPLILETVFIAGLTAVLYHRAIVPTIQAQWERMAESGRLPPDDFARMVDQLGGTAGLINTMIWQAVSWPLIMLLIAVVIWFGVGFVLGTRMRYRHALEVATWSSLVVIPSQLIAGAIGWFRGSMQGVHVGFGALVPEGDPPTKLQVGLANFLDGLGPLSIWAVVVAVLGAAALSGAPRRSVAWVLGALYVAINLFFAAMATLFV